MLTVLCNTGFPADLVHRIDNLFSDTGNELHIAFDFDGVLADSSSDMVYQEALKSHPAEAIQIYQNRKKESKEDPIPVRPLAKLLRSINAIQQGEQSQLRTQEAKDSPRPQVSLVTVRNAPADERALNILESWGLTVDGAFFLRGIDKNPNPQQASASYLLRRSS
jgi:5'-nucleotidase